MAVRGERVGFVLVFSASKWQWKGSYLAGVVILNSDRPCTMPKLMCTDQNRLTICGRIREKKLDSEMPAKRRKRN